MGSIVMGIDVVLFPFTTPKTTAFLGYQKSKLVGRRAGILLIAVGIMVDIRHQGIGCFAVWVIWGVMFILLLIVRNKREH
ncbi:MAG: hypothetical protein MR652_07595 [Blautia sp.]|uniref:hypothetical protein n=1 Tax=Blautia sp. TaxID=1955243 RepID=UPI0025BF383C|nr:hypothetical protein [Blautia sp.]MCI6303008.1 hypothetical protein [Blautia sp.]